MTPLSDPEVAAAFDRAPPRVRRKLLALRRLILETAASLDGVDAIDETLKWGEPAYLPSKRGVGTTVRLGWNPDTADEVSLLFHCQTTLVADFRERHAGVFRFEGNRRIALGVAEALPRAALADCIASALTYHRDKKRGARRRA